MGAPTTIFIVNPVNELIWDELFIWKIPFWCDEVFIGTLRLLTWLTLKIKKIEPFGKLPNYFTVQSYFTNIGKYCIPVYT